MSAQGDGSSGATAFWWAVTVLAAAGLLWVCAVKYLGGGKEGRQSGQALRADADVETVEHAVGATALPAAPDSSALETRMETRSPVPGPLETNQALKGEVAW